MENINTDDYDYVISYRIVDVDQVYPTIEVNWDWVKKEEEKVEEEMSTQGMCYNVNTN